MIRVKRGDVYYCKLKSMGGSEQDGYRPVLIIQNNKGNYFSNTVIIASMTSQLDKHNLPTHVKVDNALLPKLEGDSYILLEQVRTIDKRFLREKVGRLPKEIMDQVNESIRVSLDV